MAKAQVRLDPDVADALDGGRGQLSLSQAVNAALRRHLGLPAPSSHPTAPEPPQARVASVAAPRGLLPGRRSTVVERERARLAGR